MVDGGGGGGSGGGVVTNNGHKALGSEPDPQKIRKDGLVNEAGWKCTLRNDLSLCHMSVSSLRLPLQCSPLLLSHDHALAEATSTM